MCSIFGVLKSPRDARRSRDLAVAQSALLKHRGLDSMGIVQIGETVLVHNRISIVDVFGGGQPLVGETDGVAVAANAEIYNQASIRGRYPNYRFKTGSDCEAIIPIVLDKGADAIAELRGMFAFALVYDGGKKFYVARDRMGILSLYWGTAADGTVFVASELKALVGICETFAVFPPGHVMTEKDSAPRPYVEPQKPMGNLFKSDPAELPARLTESVEAHLMSDVDLGFLLSGGLDSSLIASIAARLLRSRGVNTLKSYSTGMRGSPDLEAARQVADFLSFDHYEYVFDLEEGIDAVTETIRHLESYDVTSVRASVPMYLLARRIRANGTKVVLTGDGADELLGGYLYFHHAPNGSELHQELVRKLTSMHLYDCLRVNKTMLSWGVEPRVPFLDRDFVTYAMDLDPEFKMPGNGRIEKHLLRESFEGYLPEAVLWRQKEQSSDGVGYGWIDGLKAYTNHAVSDAAFETAADRFPLNTPRTKEAFYYREIFETLFDHPSSASCAPAGKAAGNATDTAAKWPGLVTSLDPSGRSVSTVHNFAL
ncbi:Asparagine synthetase B [glutamine-hydrolyzing] [Pelagimonas phthalicica]|uniref:asparagine synthase (glutamine-hydrolyzing) n=1 Tax=Pelagimonas phthalicica TaxID=1037362 RepID=A0A238JDB2_9RHOB|nr:asparagine synthase B [Pelagimonas phthalicica]TDS91620.1 asparagine synthase (glutamine-hydrolysing) [Pelagimonas phthalicica]SMX28668.1 Asparagine synthetase B [glutamine-hydrolyzing] [Pelagimonas phthalicica]